MRWVDKEMGGLGMWKALRMKAGRQLRTKTGKAAEDEDGKALRMKTGRR